MSKSLGKKNFSFQFLFLNGDFRFPVEILFLVFYSAKFIEQLKSIWWTSKILIWTT